MNPDLTKAQIAKLKKVLPKCRISSSFKFPLTKEESARVIENVIRGPLGLRKHPLAELTKADYEKLTTLRLGKNQLTDVKSLEKLTQLRILLLDRNQLTDVNGLEKLTKLTGLNLANNQLTDVKGLEKLTQLKALSLVNNQLTDVKGLEKLTRLTDLRLGNNPDLTKAQIAELQKALPKCKIISNPKK
jgi:Leucine-rich repeat (LRR) protein